jgi:hypothetical protein
MILYQIKRIVDSKSRIFLCVPVRRAGMGDHHAGSDRAILIKNADSMQQADREAERGRREREWME